MAEQPANRARTTIGYTLMLVSSVGAFWLLRSLGASKSAPAPAAGAHLFGQGTEGLHINNLLHVLIALVCVIAAARALGKVFTWIKQPAVVGEITAGILLGPSLLGRVAPKAAAYLLPAAVSPFLNILSQVGVILFMFLIGIELDPKVLRRHGHTTVAISHASIIVPFLLGSGLAVGIYPILSTSDVPFTAFALFMGISMAVTAFPVLARILTDRKMHKTRMGALALTCAAVDDITAWCLLAFVVGVVQARTSGGLITAALAAGYLAVVVFVVRPLMIRLARLAGNRGQLTQDVMALTFLVLLASSLATEAIGIHAIFGAFALGVTIPHDSMLGRELGNRLEDLVVVLFLPAFFAFTGLRTEIGLVSSAQDWLLCGLIIVLASVGKFGGSAIAARLTGLGWRDAAAIGVLLNTRGLMELVVLNIGLELRVISPTLFTMLVLMALVTTFATTPILHVLTRDQPTAAPAGKPAERRGEGFLVPISNPAGVQTLIDLAILGTRESDPRPRVLALMRRPDGGVRSLITQMEEDPPLSPILAAAMDFARSRGVAVDGQARWTENPAADILEVAREPSIRWVLLGFHRPVFGVDHLGGTVKAIFDRSSDLRVDVAVVIHSHSRPLEKVVAVVDDSQDGRAALDFAIRVARDEKKALRMVLVPKQGDQPELPLRELVRRATNRWFDTDTLTERSRAQLVAKSRGDLVVVGASLTDELGLPMDDEAAPKHCLVVIQGGAAPVEREQAEAKAAS